MLLLSSLAIAGPFGLSKGMTLDEVKKLGNFSPEKEPFWYKAYKINKGHDNFEAYSVLITPTHGLCKIVGVGRDIYTNSFGEQLKSKYKELTSAITQKYGEPTGEYDFLRNGSIWTDDNDFMMGLAKKDRSLVSYWFASKGANLSDGLSAISIRASALSNSKGFINIGYDFDNVDDCLEAVKSKSNQNL